MDQRYRLVGESVGEGVRTYTFRHESSGRKLVRSCPAMIVPFRMGSSYTLEEINLACPPQGRGRPVSVGGGTDDVSPRTKPAPS
jgi:hypothetical protein